MRIFIDMDGTLAKWNNVEFEELFEQGYFANLEPNRSLVNDTRKLIEQGEDVYILSAYLNDSEYALQEKALWVERYLPELSKDNQIFVPYGTNKAEYLKEHYSPITHQDYLIDDYTKNLIEWKEFGGIGVKYLNGINHTRGTWEGLMLNAYVPTEIDASDKKLNLPALIEVEKQNQSDIETVNTKMKLTLEEAKEMMAKYEGYLYLSYTPITELPEGLKVGGSLYLEGTPITELPEGLEVGGSLYLEGTPITELPEGLKVGSSLDLRGTPITKLPEGLEVGGKIYMPNGEIVEHYEIQNFSNKYTLTSETINYCNHQLHRIQAVADFADVQKGDLGGFVESTKNLLQYGNCWVYDNAKVFDDAFVSDNAIIKDNAVVKGDCALFDNAEVHGDAIISGKAILQDFAIVRDEALVSDKAFLSDSVLVCDNSCVVDQAVIQNEAQVREHAVVRGRAVVCDNAVVEGNCHISQEFRYGGDRHFGDFYADNKSNEITKVSLKQKFRNKHNKSSANKKDISEVLQYDKR